jgi:hypothetical protein
LTAPSCKDEILVKVFLVKHFIVVADMGLHPVDEIHLGLVKVDLVVPHESEVSGFDVCHDS